MKLTLFLILFCAGSLHAQTTAEKDANWKIIEDMRKGVVQATPTPSPAVVPHLLFGDNKKNYVPPKVTKQSLSDEEKNRISGTEGGAPKNDGIWGVSLQVHEAIKSLLRDPDSYRFESVSEPWIDNYNGKRCWLERVRFRARNGFGGYSAGTAEVWLSELGDVEKIWGVKVSSSGE